MCEKRNKKKKKQTKRGCRGEVKGEISESDLETLKTTCSKGSLLREEEEAGTGPSSGYVSEETRTPEQSLISLNSPSSSSLIQTEKISHMFDAFEKRNVPKSLLRNTLRYSNKNRRSLTMLLREKGYSYEEVQKVMEDFANLRAEEKKVHTPKHYSRVLKQMLKKKSPYLEVMIKALEEKITQYKNQVIGRISQKNCQIYLIGYTEFYQEVLKYME